MTRVCIDCKQKCGFANNDLAANAGWLIAKIETERIKIDFCLCPECGSPERFVELFDAIVVGKISTDEPGGAS